MITINKVDLLILKLLDKDEYISKKMYSDIIDMCKDNPLKIEVLNLKVELHNRKFVSDKLQKYFKYFNEIYKKVDKDIRLDTEQRECVLRDEDYSLIIAGAGSGKTTTIAAKVKYLVDKKNISPEDIIVISYTNKAVNELKERINKEMNINANITTFHSLGYEILKKSMGVEFVKPKIIESKYYIFKKILEKKVYNDKKILSDLVYFLSYYLYIPEEYINFETFGDYIEHKKNSDYETLKDYLREYNKQMYKKMAKYSKTIKGEFLRSYQEVEIANFLYLNQIDYEYEKPYKYNISFLNRSYVPDFYIKQGDNEAYIEHFGMYSQNGNNNKNLVYSEKDLKLYEKRIDEKINIHNKYSTKLIRTYYKFSDGRSLIDHLKEELIKAGFVLNRRDDKDIYEQIVESSKDKYIYDLIQFIITFITRFKTLGFEESDFDILSQKTSNVRNKIFLNITKYCYVEYQKYLKENNSIDFEDMINNSIKLIDSISKNRLKLNYKYIIIDEYQDIARQRFNLTKKLADATDAKVIAVGDDWQSIFAFAGSDSRYFLEFKKLMGYADELKIKNTYRNSQELIDIASDFIQKNQTQIKKSLKSNKHIEKPICIYGYDDSSRINKNRVELLLKVIKKIVKDYGENTSILILGRYNFELEKLIESGKFVNLKQKDRIKCLDFPNTQITFLTAHKSKGLGYDNVILISAMNGNFGFPSQIEKDPILNLLDEEKIENVSFPEERRLFYVALTRTRNRVYILSPINRPSIFVQELINNYNNVYSSENINREMENKKRMICPICGFPLMYMKKRLKGSINLWVCTNEPEICDFMTNDFNCKRNIKTCPMCKDGYLIVKNNSETGQYFMGCTNFNSGCEYTESIM